METGRNVMHYALGDNQDYEHEWSKAVLEYLENGYSSEDSKSEVEVGNTTYKILKREKVTAFYDADGNTLFDIENDRLKEEYEAMESQDETEPKSEIGRAIAGIEKQAFEQAVDNNIGTDETIPMGTASLEEIAKGIVYIVKISYVVPGVFPSTVIIPYSNRLTNKIIKLVTITNGIRIFNIDLFNIIFFIVYYILLYPI